MNRTLIYAVSVLFLLAGCASPLGGAPPPASGNGSAQETPELSEEQHMEEDEESAPLDTEELLELYRDEENPTLIRVDPGLIQITDEILYGPEDLDRSTIEEGHIADSYVVTRSISYLDRWFREFERYYPRFTHELPAGDGAEAIKAHYQEKYEAALELVNQYAADPFHGEDAMDFPEQWQHYDYSLRRTLPVTVRST